jgi:hypothetical protein
MVRVSAFSIEGLEVFFHTLDHCPPHFHVLKSGEWEIRVDIDQSSTAGLVYNFKFPKKLLKSGTTLSRKQEKILLEQVLKYKVELLIEWQTKVCTREII